MQPAIVINTYNRPQALQRLLSSVARAHYPPGEEIPLVISIDRGQGQGYQEVCSLSRRYNWPYGPKQVIEQPQHLGLVEHFYCCGELTHQFEAIIYLEDDLFVSPVYYYFASQALEACRRDERIAGVSLYALWFNGYTHQPFIPLPDEADNFYLQVPYYLGQAFSRQQWEHFAAWSAVHGRAVLHDPRLHELFSTFDSEEWFPMRMRYLVDTGRFYLFPRISVAAGFGDTGTHFDRPTLWLQSPLQSFKTDYFFKSLDESAAVYDSFFEILPERLARLCPHLQGLGFTVDLYATRSRANLELQPRADQILSTRPFNQPAITYGKEMLPMEANIIEAISGKGISLGRQKTMNLSWLAGLAARYDNDDYFARRRPGAIKSIALYPKQAAGRLLRLFNRFID